MSCMLPLTGTTLNCILGTRPLSGKEEGSGHVPTFRLSPWNELCMVIIDQWQYHTHMFTTDLLVALLNLCQILNETA